MKEPQTIDVAAVIEGQKLGRFTIGLVVVSWLVTFFDGYDMNVISFTSKYLQAGFHLNAVALGTVFSSGIFGILFGNFLFGYLGDRLGRRPAIMIATGAFGVLTLLLVLARGYVDLMILRFLNGLALGGAMPLVWALNVEFAPKRFRATAVTLIMLGYGFGVAAAGPIARLLIPALGWRGVFLFGGGASLAATVLLGLYLPESVRYLAAHGRRPEVIAATLRRLTGTAPAQAAPDQLVRYVVVDETAHGGARFRLSMLFQGPLLWLTPLLWGAYFASSMSTFFITSWGPLILENMGFGADRAAYISSINALCGAAGGLAIMRFTDRHGPLMITVMPLAAIPLLLIAGLAPMSLATFFALGVVISIFLGGSHYAITSIVGLFYPSAIRASGAGWASGVAKIGSVLGPLIGSFVLSTNLPIKQTYALLAACPAAYAACALAIGLVERRNRLRAAEAEIAPSPPGVSLLAGPQV